MSGIALQLHRATVAANADHRLTHAVEFDRGGVVLLRARPAVRILDERHRRLVRLPGAPVESGDRKRGSEAFENIAPSEIEPGQRRKALLQSGAKFRLLDKLVEVPPE